MIFIYTASIALFTPSCINITAKGYQDREVARADRQDIHEEQDAL